MLSFADWLDAVRFRWKLVALTTAVLTGLALLYLAVAPRTYLAVSSLLLNNGGADPLQEGNSDQRQENTRAVIATQADLIKTPVVTDLAASTAGLTRDPALTAVWREESEGKIPYAVWLRQRLQNSVAVTPGKDSSVMAIQVSSRDPVEAARIANGFAKASVASQYRLKTEPAKTYANWLQGRLGEARNNVIQSQNALSSFVRARGITNDGDMSSEGAQMAEVATQLATAEARAAAAGGNAYAAPQSRSDAEKSANVQTLRSQVAVASSKLSNLQAQFGPDYPDVKRAQAELATLNSQLNSQLSSATSTFSAARNAEAATERGAASASQARLRALANQQRARVQTMGASLAEYERLKNEFRVSQKQFSDLNDRLSRMRLQGSIPQTEVQVLSLAATPLAPESPKPPLVLFLAILAGALLGAIGAIVLEAMNPRVRSWAGVERMLGVDVIGALSFRPSGHSGPLLLEGSHG